MTPGPLPPDPIELIKILSLPIGVALAYHGGPKRTSFEGQKMDRERYLQSQNAEGPGIYFTTDKQETRMYAADHPDGYIHTVHLDTRGYKMRQRPPDRRTLACIVNRCHDKELLYNYGSENMEADKRIAVNLYMSEETLLDAVAGIYHDLYPDDPNTFVKEMIHCGVRGWIIPKPDRIHYVVYDPGTIEIVDIEHV